MAFLLAREIPKSRCAPVRTKEAAAVAVWANKPFSGHVQQGGALHSPVHLSSNLELFTEFRAA